MLFPGLAAAFVERVGPAVPDGVELREQPEGHVQARNGEQQWESLALDEPELEEELAEETYDPPYPAFAVLEALDFVQEFVRTELDAEWERGEPWAELGDGEIRFGFADGPTFDPIPLGALSL